MMTEEEIREIIKELEKNPIINISKKYGLGTLRECKAFLKALKIVVGDG